MKSATIERMETPVYTIEDYVRLEAHSNVKHEFLDGQIFAMGGGTLEHSRLAAAVIVQLSNQLAGRPCDVFTSDARVHASAGNMIAYPDVTVCCGGAQTGSADPLAMINPTVLIEITSPSSEKYDRGTKFRRYQLILTLREYVVISQRTPAVDVFRRLDDGSWSDAELAGGGERAVLRSIGCELDVDALYRRR
jgi:Uma2 family endonuclease